MEMSVKDFTLIIVEKIKECVTFVESGDLSRSDNPHESWKIDLLNASTNID